MPPSVQAFRLLYSATLDRTVILTQCSSEESSYMRLEIAPPKMNQRDSTTVLDRRSET